MKIVFAGTPEVAIPTLERLVSEHDVVAVLTRPDAPHGRKREMTPSVVARRAHELGILTLKSSKFDSSVLAELSRLQPDLGVVVAFGGLIPRNGLDVPRLGWINLHFSHLPQWRGASPLQHEIMSGSSASHVTIFRLVEQLDAGDVLATGAFPLGAHETAGSALRRLSVDGAALVGDVVSSLRAGEVVAVPQVGPATYAPKLSSTQSQLVANNVVDSVYNLFRAVTPEPGAWIESSSGRIKILDCAPEYEVAVPMGRLVVANGHVLIGLKQGALELRRVQPAGKSVMRAVDWVRGIHSVAVWSFS